MRVLVFPPTDPPSATGAAGSPAPRGPVTPADEVAELVTRAQGGERTAFETLVRRHQRAVFYLCLRYVADSDDAKDLTQKTFVRAMSSLGELRTPATFRTWLLRVAVNLALNHLRDHSRFVRERGTEDDEPREDPDVGPSEMPAHHAALESAERAAALKELVGTLPTKQRLTLELRIYDDLPFKDIAEILEISEGAAKVNFHYAVRRLRKVLTVPTTGRKGRSTTDQEQEHDDAT